MDILTFISSLVDSLAWPASVALMVLILRKPLTELAPLLRKLKYKALELEFAEKLNEIKPDQCEISAEMSSTDLRIERYKNLLEISPNAAVSEAWSDTERSILECGLRHGISSLLEKSQGITALGKLLLAKDVISENQFTALESLRTLRNHLVHSGINISKKNAMEYVGKASLLILNIDKQ